MEVNGRAARTERTTIWWSDLETEHGTFGLASTGTGLLAVFLPGERANHEAALKRLVGGYELLPDGGGHNARAIRQLTEYLAGERREFDVPLDQRGTPFQVAVWNAVAGVPWGTTVSYGEIARRIGNPKAVRAVGAANGANPHPVIVPCHRIIGTDGTLTGYGGGLPLKKKLLQLEGIPLADGDSYRTRSLFGD